MSERLILVLASAACLVVAGCADDPPAGGSPDGGSSDASASPDASGDAGPTGVDCTGAFGAPMEVYRDGMEIPGTPSVTDDELQMFFVRGSTKFVMVERTSTTAPFTFARTLDELDATCAGGPAQSIEVSGDGLRIYFTCGTAAALPIHVADRVNRPSSFVVGADAGMVPRVVSLRADELEAYSSGGAMGAQAMIASRASRDVPFGTFELIPGLESAVLLSPVVAEDGLTLYASADPSTGPHLASATRPARGAAFGALTTDGLPAFARAGAPDLTPDCRAMYFVGAETGTSFALYVARR